MIKFNYPNLKLYVMAKKRLKECGKLLKAFGKRRIFFRNISTKIWSEN